MRWQHSTSLFVFSAMVHARAWMSFREICVSTNRHVTVYFQPIISVNFFVRCRTVAERVVRILPQEQYCEVKV